MLVNVEILLGICVKHFDRLSHICFKLNFMKFNYHFLLRNREIHGILYQNRLLFQSLRRNNVKVYFHILLPLIFFLFVLEQIVIAALFILSRYFEISIIVVSGCKFLSKTNIMS